LINIFIINIWNLILWLSMYCLILNLWITSIILLLWIWFYRYNSLVSNISTCLIAWFENECFSQSPFFNLAKIYILFKSIITIFLSTTLNLLLIHPLSAAQNSINFLILKNIIINLINCRWNTLDQYILSSSIIPLIFKIRIFILLITFTNKFYLSFIRSIHHLYLRAFLIRFIRF